MSYYFKIKTDKRKGKRIMKNDNSIVKFTAFVLLITMVVLCLVSGTFAKYTSEFSATDSAVVARWSVSDGNIEETFDIFKASKIYDTVNGIVTEVDEDVSQENGADSGDALGKIAPGTWGKFEYTLLNDSEVTAEYTITYDAKENGVPLLWSTDGSDWKEEAKDLNVTKEKLAVSGDKKIEIYWKWDFEVADADGFITTRDAADTALGQASTLAVPTIDVDVVFEQVD